MMYNSYSKQLSVGDIFINQQYNDGIIGLQIFNTLKRYIPKELQSKSIFNGKKLTTKELVELISETVILLKKQLKYLNLQKEGIHEFSLIMKNQEKGVFSEEGIQIADYLIEIINGEIKGFESNLNTVIEAKSLLNIYIHQINQNNTFSNKNPFQHLSRPLPMALLNQKNRKQQKMYHHPMENKSAEEIIALMDMVGFTNSMQFKNKIEKAQKRVKKDLFQHLSLSLKTQTDLRKNIFDSYSPLSFNEIRQLHSGLFVGKPSYSDGAYRLIFNPETKEIVDICPHKRYERKYLSKKKK